MMLRAAFLCFRLIHQGVDQSFEFLFDCDHDFGPMFLNFFGSQLGVVPLDYCLRSPCGCLCPNATVFCRRLEVQFVLGMHTLLLPRYNQLPVVRGRPTRLPATFASTDMKVHRGIASHSDHHLPRGCQTDLLLHLGHTEDTPA